MVRDRVKQLERIIFSLIVLFASFQGEALAEFELNFQSNPNVVSSIANVSCNTGTGGMMDGMGGMGGMGALGPGCGSDTFRQEVVNDNGTLYYHIILGDVNDGDFALEFYIRTGGCCWWGGGMMGGMGGMGGDAPYSSSYGDTNNALANAYAPLAAPLVSGTGTGNPNRVYMLQLNQDLAFSQVYEKQLESNKPRITQQHSDNSIQENVILDMSNGDHNGVSPPARIEITQTFSTIASADFDINTHASSSRITAGMYSYTAGPGQGQSYGSYEYESGNFDVYSVNWTAYCDEQQNPDHNCTFNDGGGGNMMGGMMGF